MNSVTKKIFVITVKGLEPDTCVRNQYATTIWRISQLKRVYSNSIVFMLTGADILRKRVMESKLKIIEDELCK